MRFGQSKRIQEASAWLLRLQDDELSQEQIAAWIEWSQKHPERLQTFEEVKALWLNVKALDADRKAVALRRLISPELREVGVRKIGASRYSLAATVLIAVLAGGWLWRYHGAPSASLRDTYATVKAESRQLSLPDGTKVDLGASTHARVAYTSIARTVELSEGEAYFRVAHDPTRPFFVRVGEWQLIDIGTAFNVRKTNEHVVITVADGIVDVTKASGSGKPLRLRAGDQAAMELAKAAPSVVKVDAGTASSWQQGQLRFDDEPLSVVLANLNRYSKREIVVADPAIGEMKFSGTVLVENVDGWLAATCRVFGLRQQLGDDNHVLLYLK